jgi:hypothetical protein
MSLWVVEHKDGSVLQFCMKQHSDSSAAWKECDMERSYSLSEFARQNDIGLTTVRGEIKAGRLVARKVGRRTIIMAEDANDWRNRLPQVQPRIRKSADGAEIMRIK